MINEKLSNYVSSDVLESSQRQMTKVKEGNILKHTLVNNAPDFFDQQPYYLQDYKQYLKTRNFSIMLECEGRETI